MIKLPDQKQLRGGKGPFQLAFPGLIYHWGHQAGTEEETMKKFFFFFFTGSLFWILLNQLSYTIQDPLPRSGTAQSGTNPPVTVNNQENAPQILTGQSDGGSSSLEAPSS